MVVISLVDSSRSLCLNEVKFVQPCAHEEQIVQPCARDHGCIPGRHRTSVLANAFCPGARAHPGLKWVQGRTPFSSPPIACGSGRRLDTRAFQCLRKTYAPFPGPGPAAPPAEQPPGRSAQCSWSWAGRRTAGAASLVLGPAGTRRGGHDGARLRLRTDPGASPFELELPPLQGLC